MRSPPRKTSYRWTIGASKSGCCETITTTYPTAKQGEFGSPFSGSYLDGDVLVCLVDKKILNEKPTTKVYAMEERPKE